MISKKKIEQRSNERNGFRRSTAVEVAANSARTLDMDFQKGVHSP